MPDMLSWTSYITDDDNPVIIAYRPVVNMDYINTTQKPLREGVNHTSGKPQADWYYYQNDGTPRHLRLTTTHMTEEDWAVAFHDSDTIQHLLENAEWSVYDQTTGVTTLEYDIAAMEPMLMGIIMYGHSSYDSPQPGEFYVEVSENTSANRIHDDRPFTTSIDGKTLVVTTGEDKAIDVALYNIDGSLLAQTGCKGETRLELPSGRMLILRVCCGGKTFTTRLPIIP